MATIAGQIVTGALGSAVLGTPFQPLGNKAFNIFISGTFSATVAVVRSYDGGTTWVPVPLPTLAAALTFTAPTSIVAFEPDASVIWAVSTAVANGGAYVSGSVVYRIGS